MKKVFFKAVILAFVLLFGMTIISCDDGGGRGGGGGGGDSDWINVTSLAQLNGTWKGTISYTETNKGITYKMEQEITVIINASARTVTSSYISKETMSGFRNDEWITISSLYTSGTQTSTQTDEDGITYTYTVTTVINNLKLTITQTRTMHPQTRTITDADIAEMLSSGMQISKDGRRLRELIDDPDARFNEMIYYKQ